MSELPPGWAETTIGDVCAKPQYGWTTKAAKTGAVQLLRTTDITRGPIDWNSVPWCATEPPNLPQFLLRSGDIVVSRAGSVGISAMVHDPRTAVFASYLMRLRPDEEVSARFVAWFLMAPSYWRQVESARAGIALQNINATKLASFEMPLPPLAEQRRIVAAIEEQFSRLDAAAATLGAASLRIKALRRAASREAFSAEWPERPLVELTPSNRPICYGILMPKADFEGGVPYVRVRDFPNDRIDVSTLRRTAPEIAEKYRRSILAEGDVLISIRGTFGRVATVPAELAGANITQDTARITPSTEIDGGYLAAFLRSEPAQRFFGRVARGVAVKGVNIGDLRQLPVPLPSLADQCRIVAELEQQLSLIDSLRAAVEAAQKRSAALRRAILKRAFRGELVPQDPADEPASVLLERIRADRAAEPPRKRGAVRSSR